MVKVEGQKTLVSFSFLPKSRREGNNWNLNRLRADRKLMI
jgi:hypothetical protein